MIHLPLHQIFLIPLLFCTLLILGLWCFYSVVEYRAYRRAKRTTRLYRCDHCRHVYLDHREVPLTRCPSCGALNEAVRQ